MATACVGFDGSGILRRSIDSQVSRGCGRLCGAQPFDPIEHPLGIVQRCSTLDGIGHEAARQCHIAFVKRFDALMKDGFGFALPLGLCATRPLDVGAGSTVVTIEEQDARPQVDGLFVLGGEILIEAREQQLLDSGVPLGAAQRLGRSGVGTKGVVGCQMPLSNRRAQIGCSTAPPGPESLVEYST